jgi:phosphoribosyl 1,2-cyclic phosphate phosphodiesterase
MGTFTFLGTGTSQGVPIIGCDCDVCTSTHTNNTRLRTAALLTTEQTVVVIDAGPDFRQQVLRARLQTLDALLLTHAHMDHVAGIDDIRPFNHRSKKPLKVYAELPVQKRIEHQFDYAFKIPPYPGVPQIQFEELRAYQTFEVGDLKINPLRALHGNLPVMGFRVGNLGYITDVNCLPDATLAELHGCDVMVLSALHHTKHHSHYNLEEALAIFEKIGAQRNYITHISHHMGLHAQVQATLPSNVFLAYDGLQVDFE